MANGSSLRRERREVGFSWLGHSDTETWFTLPQQRHVFPRNKKVADLFAYKSTSICNLTHSEVTHIRKRRITKIKKPKESRTSEEPKKHPLFLKPFPFVLCNGQTTKWIIVFPRPRT
jgi:hypothetical protein